VNGGYELLPRDTSDFVHITVTKVANAYTGIPTSFVWKTTTRTRSTLNDHSVRHRRAESRNRQSLLGARPGNCNDREWCPESELLLVVWNGTNSRAPWQAAAFISTALRRSCGWKDTIVHASEENVVDEVSVKQAVRNLYPGAEKGFLPQIPDMVLHDTQRLDNVV